MEDYRISTRTLFGWLPQKHPPGGPRKRWRDVVKADLKIVGVLDTWYTLSLHGNMWNRLLPMQYRGIKNWPGLHYHQYSVFRTFQREQDRARHKCIEEQSKPVGQQQGALQCSTCGRWFRSGGVLKCTAVSCQQMQ